MGLNDSREIFTMFGWWWVHWWKNSTCHCRRTLWPQRPMFARAFTSGVPFLSFLPRLLLWLMVRLARFPLLLRLCLFELDNQTRARITFKSVNDDAAAQHLHIIIIILEVFEHVISYLLSRSHCLHIFTVSALNFCWSSLFVCSLSIRRTLCVEYQK